MTDFDLLKTVQPEEGYFCILGIKGKSVLQKFVATRQEADAVTNDFVQQKRNVFFAVSKYQADDTRTKGNVKALKAFWLDIDCGVAKAEPNAKTGIPDGYIDQSAAGKALHSFCTLVGLPKPIIVNSGRGYMFTGHLPRRLHEKSGSLLPLDYSSFATRINSM